MGGGPSSETSTSHQNNKLPKWLQPWAKEFIGQAGATFFPGGKIDQNAVAPFTPDQLKYQQLTEGLTGPETQFLHGAQNQQQQTISGANLDPSSNKYLQDYYNAAALPMEQNYQQTVAPNLLANAVASGGLGSSGSEQAFKNAQSGLAQGLGNLAANIYEPAYMQERQLQENASGNAAAIAGGQYLPSQQLGDIGRQQQQQQQNVLDKPFELLSMFGPMIGQAAGGTGRGGATTTVPNSNQGMK